MTPEEKNNRDLEEILKNRTRVIGKAIILEAAISQFLGWMLDIQNLEETITLGNKSSSLPLNYKVSLLIDIGAVGKENQEKFRKFME